MLDHLVYAVPDLIAGIEKVQAMLGAMVSPGGGHERWGTRNALLGVGSRRYLEVVGPDPDAPGHATARPFGIDDLPGPRLATWCVAPPDLDKALESLRRVGYDPGPPIEMSRRTPGGTLLSWRMAMPPGALPAGGVLPFLIDWGTTPHPSESAPSNVTLTRLSAEHPNPRTVRRVLDMLGVDLPIRKRTRPGLIAEFETPNGRVELH